MMMLTCCWDALRNTEMPTLNEAEMTELLWRTLEEEIEGLSEAIVPE